MFCWATRPNDGQPGESVPAKFVDHAVGTAADSFGVHGLGMVVFRVAQGVDFAFKGEAGAREVVADPLGIDAVQILRGVFGIAARDRHVVDHPQHGPRLERRAQVAHQLGRVDRRPAVFLVEVIKVVPGESGQRGVEGGLGKL